MRSFALIAGLLIAIAVAHAQSAFFTTTGSMGPQLTAPANNVPPEQRCIVSGQVTNALTGEPVKKVNLRLTAANQAPQGYVGSGSSGMPSMQGYAITTDADGTFRIEGIEPGTYNLAGQRTGFLNSYYGAKGPDQMGTSITLAPSQSLVGITLSLTPQAVLSGKVLDEDGEPSAGTMIQVLAPMWQRGKKRYLPRQSTNTNDLGEFRIANIGPGKYFLSAQHHPMFMGQGETVAPANGKPDIRPILTYYPGTPNMESAAALEVRPGQDLAGLEIRMQSAQTYHVRGHVTGVAMEEGKQHGVVTISPKNSVAFFMPGGQSPIKPDGSFDISGISPGSYNVNLMLMSGNVRTGGSQAVEVAGSDVNNINLTTAATFTVRGVLRTEGSPSAGTTAVNLAGVQPHLYPTDFGVYFPSQTKIEKDGSFTIENVTGGNYAVNVQPPSGTYLKSVLNGQTEVKNGDLDLTGGAPAELQIILSYGVAEVSGIVQSPKDANAGTSAQILVLPEPLNPNNLGVRLSNTDMAGSFSLKQIAPGHYRAFALAQFDPSQTQNPEILKQLASRGTEFEVKENDRKQITLPLLSAEELKQLEANAEGQ